MKKETSSKTETTAITGIELMELEKCLTELGDLKPRNPNGARFIYAVNKNFEKVTAILKRIRKMMHNLPEGYQQYIGKRFDAALESGGRQIVQPDGTPAVVEIKNQERFYSKETELKKEYADAIKSAEKIIKDNDGLFKRSYDDEPIQWHKAKYKYIPAELTSRQRASIMFMLKEPDDADFEEMDFSEDLEQV